MTKRIYGCIWVGLGGFHADFFPGPRHELPGGGSYREGAGHLSGYDSDPDKIVEACLRSGDIPDGTPFIDKRAALEKPGGVGASFRSPMLDLSGERENFTKEEIASHPIAHLPGGFGDVARGAILGVINLDNASVKEYVTYWHKAGARIGYVMSNKIVWMSADWPWPGEPPTQAEVERGIHEIETEKAAEASQERVLKCDMLRTCEAPVTHIDDKGFIYCASHGQDRKAHCRCRKLKPAEIKKLKLGGTVERY
jgi:hypothetical protein